MTRKVWLLIVLAVLLGGLSLYLNKDWFSKDNIQIYHRSRPWRGRMARRAQDDSPVNPIVFGFDRKLKLTDLKIVPVSDIETNKYPQPVWHLVSESNSVPVKDFMYGSRIAGMHPALKDTKPEPLEPGVKYRLFVQAGNQKAEHDFVPDPHTQ
jgi:hypothetical protein